MLSLRNQATYIIRSCKNSHRFIYFVNGKIRSFSTHIDDINSQVSELFGALNRGLTFSLMSVGVLTALSLAMSAQEAFALDPLALPEGYQSVAGNQQFDRTPGNLTITSDANRSIVNYQSFNVGSQASVIFNLPSANASILNRVIGGNLSEIYGSISSNGNVFLVNPAGIVIGKGAIISVNGLVASTLDITNQKFLSGQYEFSRVLGSSPASIQVDQGAKIKIGSGGTAAFLASLFLNNGNISAPGGAIQIGVGDRITLGTDLIGLTVNEPLKDVLNQVAVVNTGNLTADQVKIVASVLKGNIHNTLVNNSGHITANKLVDGEGGTIELIADNGLVVNTGTIDASGTTGGQIILQGTSSQNAGQLLAVGTQGSGGTVHVLGTDSVALTDNAAINVSGQTAGGTVLIGGDTQGSNAEIPNAATAYVGANARIHADALGQGNGGKIVVWGNQTTGYYGQATAKGGVLGGNGGFVETSGKNLLDMQGQVDASATNGVAGTWLLDPRNVLITNSTNNIFSSFDPITGTETETPISLSGASTVNASLINTALNSGTNVTINTGLTDADAGNITVDSAINKTGGSDATFSLLAANDINVNQSIASSAGKLNLVLQADNDISALPTSNGVGTVNLNAGGTTNNGSVTLSGVAINIAANINAGSGSISAAATNGNLTQTAGDLKASTITFTAAGGNIQQTGGTLASQQFNATTTSAGKSISLIDTDVNQANLHSNNGNITFQDRDGLGVNVQAGSGTATITADVGSILLHSNNGVAGSGINLSGVNNAQTLNLLTYHGGISQDVGSTLSGITLNAESQDPAHLGIAFKDADFKTASFKTNNGLISYKDQDGVKATVDAGTGNADITTFASGTLSNNGSNESSLNIIGVNKAKTLSATAVSGDVLHNSGAITTTAATSLIANNGNVVQSGNSAITAQTFNLTATNGDVIHLGGLTTADTVNFTAQNGNVSYVGGILNAGTANLHAEQGHVSQNGGSINVTSANLSSVDGNVVQNGGDIKATNTVNLLSTNGNVVANSGAIRAKTANLVATNGNVVKNGGLIQVDTANYVAKTGDVLYNGGNTIALTANVTAQNGNLYYTGGNINAGNANLFAEQGNVTFSDGSINAITANLRSQDGNVVTNGGTLNAHTANLLSANGNVTTNNGTIHANTANLVATNGNVIKNAGLVNASTVNYVAKTGNVLYLGGNTAGNIVNLAAYNGNTSFTGGNIGAGTVNLYTEHGNLVYSGSTNALTANLWSNDGSVFANGGTINVNTANLLSTNGNVVANNGAIHANAANLIATNGNVLKNGGLVNATTANYVAKNGSVAYNGGVTTADTVNVTAQNGNVLYNGGIIGAGKAHLYADHGNVTQNGGNITASSMSLIADQGNITQNAGTLTTNYMAIKSLNGDITLKSKATALQVMTLTTANDALNPSGGTISLTSTALLQSLTGSISLNTNHLTLDGSVQGKLVQIAPYDSARSILLGGLIDPNALSLTQAMLGHINTDPALGQNTIMIGNKDYLGSVTLGSVDLSGHTSTSLLIDAPKVLELTPGSDPAGSFNIRMADNQSVYLTAGATGLSDWSTAKGGTNYGDNSNILADLDIQVSGQGTINVNLLGSGPMTANSFSLINGSQNKAFINVSPPALLGIAFFDDGFTSFKNYAHTLNATSSSSIQNSIKGNTINLPSTPGQIVPNNFGLFLSNPSLGSTSL